MKIEGRYIHYCWFGGKPLPKLARKCLESWKRFLPDYEIICWNESNSDLDECEFVREAYKLKQYAFVADYVRTKAICEMGGIYLDTDMEIIKDPKGLMRDYTTFLGVEDTGKVCCGVWYEKYPNSFLSTELLEKYRGLKDLDFEKRNEFSIPLLITEILEPCGFDYRKRRIQVLKHDITVFPREYFYPYSYNRTNNIFTDNTCMIHYYDASWLPVKNRIENSLVRRYGRVRALQMIKAYQKSYVLARKTARTVLYPVVIYRKNKGKKALINDQYLTNLNRTLQELKKKKNAAYIVLHNGGWFGVTSATKEMFKNNVDCRELYRRKDIDRVAEALVATGAKQIIFSAMSEGGASLIRKVHRIAPGVPIKVFWHGSMSQVLDPYGWKMHKDIMRLCKDGHIVAFATCKKSLFEFYKSHDINVFFITNSVKAKIGAVKQKRSNKTIKIGLYAASPTNWRKNMFSQIAAVSLLNNASLDIVPLDEISEKFARNLGVSLTGVSKNLTRNELLARMSENDVNLYVTYSECSPMLPLESLEMGVPCLTGNNHHYFVGSELEEKLVVSQEGDICEIRDKIRKCAEGRDAILEQYKLFREKNFMEGNNDVKSFLEAK